MADQMMGQAPEMGGEDDAAADASQGYCIEIRVDADGKIKVGVESLADEQAEESQGGEPAESEDSEEYQEVGSIGEALRVVKDIYTNAGNMQDMGANESEMDSGYGMKAKA